MDTPAPSVLSVLDLVRGVKTVVGRHFADVWVEGELSNVRRPASGHCYFTLKDAGAQIRCVLWRSQARHLFFRPEDGLLVRVRGEVTLYEARGDLQVMVREMTLAGEGALQRAFEALKQKLAAEGLFDARHKQPLPPFPEAIGIITSGTGAALPDILSILERRFPAVRALVCPVQVQGLGAAEAIAEAVESFNALPPGDPLRPDVLIVGRGGGSAEDLWAFNEEIVARALFASRIPVISAVGHETDVSIADFVADVRAATPSMAAELAVPDRRELRLTLRGLHATLQAHVTGRIEAHRRHLHHLAASRAFHRPVDRLREYGLRLDDLAGRLARCPGRQLEARRQHLQALADRLALLDPHRPLRQGFARVERDGRPVSAASDLAPGDAVTLHFDDGRRDAQITT